VILDLLWRSEFWTALRHNREMWFFIGKTIISRVQLAEIPPIEQGAMETGRKMNTAAAWREAAMAALPAPAPADW
jgi:hypothetical protein